MDLRRIYTDQQTYFASGATRSYTFRKQQLKRLKQAIHNHESAIMKALHADLRKPAMEAYASEVGIIYDEISNVLDNLKHWMKPEEVTSPFLQYPSRSRIYKEPLGLTLLIGPWNYPFQLLAAPLVGAIAGGNCAILKPSELAPYTAAVLELIIKEAFDPAYITVIQGEGSEVIPAMMQYRFDHVFFTGSTVVGRKIMEMAAPHLTPVTLELGGKSPCVVDDKVNIDVAAKRIIWGKCWNAGQTCIAPDYVLVHRAVKDDLVKAMQKAITSFFGDNPATSPDYARIINANRFDALSAYLSQGRVITGGNTNREDLYIAPTLIEDVQWSAPLMQEEIFGPILPILPFDNIEQAIQLIRQYPYPLSLYVFTKRSKTEKALLEQIRFGGGCVNSALTHFTNQELPFGGTGLSGIGRYHGYYSFETFTHRKGVMKTATWLDVPVKYPPYGNKVSLLKKMMK